MPVEGRTVLLDVTRLISRSWTARHSTGLDRVCYAYLRHYRADALAVVQHRGVVRVLDPRRSDRLFAMLTGPTRGFRRRLVTFMPRAIADAVDEEELGRMAYLNISHTDFDLDAHFGWVRRSGVRPAYFIHDLIPILHPEFTRPHSVRRHLGRVRGALAQGDAVIVSSRAVARDLERFSAREGLRLPATIIAPIAGEVFAPDSAQDAACGSARGSGVDAGQEAEPAADRQGDTPFFLTVGTIEPRKNHRLLFEIWRDLARRMGAATPRLVIVGQQGPLTGDILSPLQTDPALAANIQLHTQCPDAHLSQLLADARALLMPSLAEGFGLPLVEALQAQTPAIASDLPVFREVAQGCATLLDPADTDAWRGEIMRHAAGRQPLARRFAAPDWDSHFASIDAWVRLPRLKTRSACESSMAA